VLSLAAEAGETARQWWHNCWWNFTTARPRYV